MLITKTLKVKITFRNIDFYKEKGYDVKMSDVIDVSTEDFPFYCRKEVEVECDKCHTRKTIRLTNYHKNILNYGYYACSQTCAHDKVVKTCETKYNTDNCNKLESSHKKTKATKLRLHGDENYTNVEKMEETCMERFGAKSNMCTQDFKDKSKATMIEKLGVEHALQNPDIMQKTIDTNMKKFGTKTPLQNEEVKEKIRTTKKKNHGDENYNNRPKYFATCLDRFGDTSPMRNEEIKQKLVDTFLRKYGETSPMKVTEIAEKCFKSGLKIKQYNENIYYQGTYEKDFLDKYYDKMTIVRGEPLKYELDGKIRTYYPDFYIEELNLMVEIKSTHWYNVWKDMNIAKQEATIAAGYNFIFIINKKYEEFENIISK